MDYEIILSPDLGVSAEEFAHAWNATPETHHLATAHTATTRGAQFDPNLLVTVIISVSSSIATGVSANAIYEQIKKLMEKRKGHKHTHIERTTKPDGTERLIVDIDE